MLATLPAGRSRIEGSFWWIFLSAVAIVQADAAIWIRQALENNFVDTATGAYLDLIAARYGLIRKPAVSSTGVVSITGIAGTLIPAGTRVSRQAAPGVTPILYATGTYGTIPGSAPAIGVLTLPIVAVTPGVAGNAPAHAITILVDSVGGVLSLDNAAATAGGINLETDALLRARVAFRASHPASSGNVSDYVTWALEVDGVGGVSVGPLVDGPGTVGVYIIDADGAPGSPTLVAAVQNHIAPKDVIRQEVESAPWSNYGAGVSTDATIADDSGSSKKLVYDVIGVGRVVSSAGQDTFTAAGVWTLRARVKASDDHGTTPLMRLSIMDTTAGGYARTTPSASPIVDATRTLTAHQIGTAWTWIEQDFYWDGAHVLEPRVERMQSDTTTILWVDRVELVSAFGSALGAGLAPVGARVTVRPAVAVHIAVLYRLVIRAGYAPATVKAAVQTSLAAYFRATSFEIDAVDRVIRYHEIGKVIKATAGVLDYTDLTVNGGTDEMANITLRPGEVAVFTAIALMTWDEFDMLGLTWDDIDRMALTWDTFEIAP